MKGLLDNFGRLKYFGVARQFLGGYIILLLWGAEQFWRGGGGGLNDFFGGLKKLGLEKLSGKGLKGFRGLRDILAKRFCFRGGGSKVLFRLNVLFFLGGGAKGFSELKLF